MTKLYLGSAIYCFVVSELAKNYSQVDKFWSLIPIAYVWYFAYAAGYDDRMVMMALLVTFWGLRLTYNFARRGGFSIYFWKGEEDYRWVEVKKAIPFLSSIFRRTQNFLSTVLKSRLSNTGCGSDTVTP